MGEILRVDRLSDVVRQQQEREFRFFSQDDLRRLELPGNLAVNKPSPYTHNIVGYMERPEDQLRVDALGVSRIDEQVQAVYLSAKERQEGIKQIFSSASEHSSLIIEYVQRFGDFDGFFTKQNVAELTYAAGVDDELKEMQAEAMRAPSPSSLHH